MSGPISLRDFEESAAAVLPAGVNDWVAGGAEDEQTVAGNRAAFSRRVIRGRVLADVSARDQTVTLLGTRLAHPIVIAPTALHQIAHPDGELATARGAAASGALYAVSTAASVRLEDVAAAAPGAPRWFQLYHAGTQARSESLLRRAVAAGYSAILLTVDVPILGRRERDLRNRFVLPKEVRMANVDESDVAADERDSARSWANPIADSALRWDDLGWIRAAAGGLPLLVKGVVRADDAERAVAAGCAGIWVSNHGGRQQDGAIASLDALPEIADAVGDRAAIVVDGGVRRGTDVLKAIALGANAVALGRPIFWGLAVGGALGVQQVIETLRRELDAAMALAGCSRIVDIDRSLVRQIDQIDQIDRIDQTVRRGPSG